MTRVIAGTAGGRTLRTPPGSGTRPTSERVREALFSALEARGSIRGAQVLDLYAGSGALGLEAASRGAAGVVLVESDRRAADVAARNVRGLGLTGVRVARQNVASFLADRPAARYDLVLLDPPYGLPEDALTADLVRLADHWLADGAVVVVERSTRSPEPGWPEGLAPTGKPRRYGETTLWLAEQS
jgi:16S rRNA (guanine966-N2)-methyltransferase